MLVFLPVPLHLARPVHDRPSPARGQASREEDGGTVRCRHPGRDGPWGLGVSVAPVPEVLKHLAYPLDGPGGAWYAPRVRSFVAVPFGT